MTRRSLTIACIALLCIPLRAEAQIDSLAQPVHPELRWRVEAPLFASGAALLVIGKNLSITRKTVPPEGLDPSDVGWSVDRRVIGKASTRADANSDNYRDAAFVYPVVLAYISQPAGSRAGGTFRRSVEYSEALMVAEGFTLLLKGLTDRPRPFTYLPVDQRPDDDAYDVTDDDSFRSMPSGHATSAFCAAGFAVADLLISRPDASWQARVGAGLVGGFLAGATVGLRIEGGQHFPSDAVAGGLIGTAAGIGVPLIHHHVDSAGQRAALPSGRAWRDAFLGEAIGITLGVLVAKTY
jgi:hypothetical protein